MGLKLAAIVVGAMLSSVAMAQDYGLTIGFHQTTATASTGATGFPSGSAQGKLNYDLGLTASFELVPNFRFRSGILYDTRNYDYKVDNNVGTIHINYSYIDIPVNVQYNFTPMIGIYGGLIVGIKASNTMDMPGNLTYNGTMKSMYPLANFGVNFMFNDMIGFDVYGESGLGEFADSQKNYQTFGLHFIYWL